MPVPPQPPAPAALEPTPSAELELVRRLQRGDGDAFAQLLHDHGGPLLATARRMLGGEDDARDALQDAFLSAFRAIATFEQKSRLSTWLHRILVNAVLMKLRSRRRRPECALDDLLPQFTDDGHHVEPPCPFSDAALRTLQSAESRTVLWQAIDQLPPPYREVVVLRDIEGLSTEAAASHLDITTNAVKIRLHRARQALRSLLGDTFEDQHDLP